MTNTYHQLASFLLLILASVVPTGMVLARFLYSGERTYAFLVWNLFLAWMPLIFAILACQTRRIWPLFMIFGFLWLLFFPNAPYLVTDLLHLKPRLGVPFWYDVILTFTFALTGLVLGFASLHLMQMAITRRFGAITGWFFVTVALGLSSFGVYVGRFLRWNSWDLFVEPFNLLQDIFYSLTNPFMFLKTLAISLLLSAVFTCAYVILFSLPLLSGQGHHEQRWPE